MTTSTINDSCTFADLGVPEPLVGALAHSGVTTPFPIQQLTIPDVLAGRDVLGRGQTGSGKTLAFGVPTLARLSGGRTQARRPRAVVLVPTRELATQVSDALTPLARAVGLTTAVVVGGVSYGKQITALERGADLVVATPGRLTDLVQQNKCSLGAVEIAVLDEADHMADLGFLPAVRALLDLTPAGGQRLLFSATLDRDVDVLVKRYLTNPVTHSTAPAQASVTTMAHHVLVVEAEAKAEVTAHIAARDGRTILFLRTKHGVDRLATQLRRRGVVTGALHGGKSQAQRNQALDAFKTGQGVLVTTDVAARGIHVDDVSLVVNVDPPNDHKDYLHRAGRTARAGAVGTVVTLALPNQKRAVELLTRKAGVQAGRTRAVPGDAQLGRLTGAREPSGVPVVEPVVAAPVARRRPARHSQRSQHAPRSQHSPRPQQGGDARRQPRRAPRPARAR